MDARARTWGLRFRAREWLDRSWIVIPSVYVVAALALGKLVPSLEGDVDQLLGIDLADDSSRDILQAVASGMIAFTGLVVSVAVVVVQFGAGQYTPRLVLFFRRDPVVKHALGIFIAPALYALVSLGDVGGPNDTSVPNLTVAVAVVLLVGAVFAFFTLTGRLLDLLRPRRLYGRLLSGAEHAIDQVYPRDLDAGPAPEAEDLPPVSAVIPYSGESGVLSALDLARLVETAAAADATVEVAWRIGGYVRSGGQLFYVRGPAAAISVGELQRAAIVAEERTIAQDPAFAMRAIVDIAIRALSPAVNDPTTAVQGIDALEALLHRLAERELGAGELHDASGRLRVVYRAADWPDMLELALTEIRTYGAGAPQVTRRLHALLNGLLDATPAVRHEAIRRQLGLLDVAVERAHPDPEERAIASSADHMGLGGREGRAD